MGIEVLQAKAAAGWLAWKQVEVARACGRCMTESQGTLRHSWPGCFLNGCLFVPCDVCSSGLMGCNPSVMCWLLLDACGGSQGLCDSLATKHQLRMLVVGEAGKEGHCSLVLCA